jgi:hypothetical protein
MTARFTVSALRIVLVWISAAIAAGSAPAADEVRTGVEHTYVLNCGESRTTDLSKWSPGFNVSRIPRAPDFVE